ncbi:hypothetical protein [Umezakia ovalisporum]|jgi:hypothetical protein|uniref:hypothetical protein n=1 Tax=Umezakia ovalisporum TaxID=75695 RepID=UPI002476DDDE|nr:hypothetical protein [Umezakia ovalisporum]MBI1240820.1 hypothetical protein [Nostoc sp. RI_552]MDH6083603.1 hypothetical protein [Umezakia ovalisporum TAC611]
MMVFKNIGSEITAINGSTVHVVDEALRIDKPKAKIDSYAMIALEDTKEDIFGNSKAEQEEAISYAKDRIISDGLTGLIENLSHRLNAIRLDDINQLLLSTPEIYAYLIINCAIDKDKVPKDDLDGLYSSVVRNVRDTPKRYFLSNLLARVLFDLQTKVDSENPQWKHLPSLAMNRGINIRDGQVKLGIQDLLNSLYKVGNIPYYLQLFIEGDKNQERRTVLPKNLFTPIIQQGMLDILVSQGIRIDDDKFKTGDYDKYFIFSYYEALKRSNVADDPIDMARKKGSQVDWDFSVDVFDSTEQQGVIPANIKAAGALDYIYYIGEGMRVFDVANALVLRWASGALDIPEGKAAAALYRFHKLRSDRSTPEERAMLYKRVLNRGNGQLLSSMMPNTVFPRYWHALMSEVTQYISKKEGMGKADNQPSRSQLYQAVKNLQYNLTEYMTGMAHLQVTEDYAHLQEAMELLKMEEIINHFGGRRKSLWNVIESVAKQDLGVTVQTSVMRDLAVEGNKIYQWIANFNEAMVREEEFKTFLKAAEAWIIAQASLQDPNDSSFNGKGQAHFDAFNDKFDDDLDDNFDNW